MCSGGSTCRSSRSSTGSRRKGSGSIPGSSRSFPGVSHATSPPSSGRWTSDGATGTDFNIYLESRSSWHSFSSKSWGFPQSTKTRLLHGRVNLERLEDLHEIPSLVLEYRTVAKIRSSTSTSCRGGSTRGTGGWRRPANAGRTSRALSSCPIRTCRTSRSAPSSAAGSGQGTSREGEPVRRRLLQVNSRSSRTCPENAG